MRVQPAGVVGQRLPDLLQRGPRRHPDPARHEALAVGELEVEAGAGPLRVLARAAARVAVVELAGGVGLVRRLVGREPDVAVDPEDRAPRVAHDLGREPRQPDVHLLDQRSGADRAPRSRRSARWRSNHSRVLCRARRRRKASAAGRKPRNSDVVARGGIGRVTSRSFSGRVSALDRELPAERRAAVGGRLDVDQPHRPARAGVRGAAARRCGPPPAAPGRW